MAVVAVAVAVAACGGGGVVDERPFVVVSTTVLGDLVSRIAGDAFRVEVMMPPGVDPHEYAASAADAADLRDATLVVVNGLGLEAGLADAFRSLPDRVTVLEVGPAVDPMSYPGGVSDPHVWFDPARMAVAAGVIGDALTAVSPGSAAEIDASTESVRASLLALDNEVTAILASVPAEHRLLVANHDFLRYFADRYGFEVVGSVIPGGSTVEQPGAGVIAALAEVIRTRGVTAVFAEATEPTYLADALASEAGNLPVVTLFSDALGEGGSYADLIRTDATRIAEALK